MKKHVQILTIVSFGLLFVSVGAHAQLLMDQSIGSALGAGAQLGAASQHVGVGAIVKRLTMQGYTNIRAVPGNPQQFIANAPGGVAVTLLVNGATGQVVSAMPR